MKTIIFSFALMILVGSCSKNSNDLLISNNDDATASMESKMGDPRDATGQTDIGDISGEYTGTFERSGDASTGDNATSDVTMKFSGNTYTGSSSTTNYPAICSDGNYKMSGSTIDFTDGCLWKGDFDQSLRMKGTYNISQDKDGSLRIWRTKGTTTDQFKLFPKG